MCFCVFASLYATVTLTLHAAEGAAAVAQLACFHGCQLLLLLKSTNPKDTAHLLRSSDHPGLFIVREYKLNKSQWCLTCVIIYLFPPVEIWQLDHAIKLGFRKLASCPDWIFEYLCMFVAVCMACPVWTKMCQSAWAGSRHTGFHSTGARGFTNTCMHTLSTNWYSESCPEGLLLS